MKKTGYFACVASGWKKEMSIGVCVRMDEWGVALFTLALPFLVMMLSHVMRVDAALRKELDFLEPVDGQCYFSDDM